MIDETGYRLNVGIIITNDKGQLLWAKRVSNTDAWQFPQGGMHKNETPKQAMFRELKEELGLNENDVTLIAETKNWLHYELPEQFRRYDSLPLCIGQKQKWFLLQLRSDESGIRFDHGHKPEFNEWRWVDYWYPLDHVIEFKRDVYKNVLMEFESAIKTIGKQQT